jgi:hypothetical protein
MEHLIFSLATAIDLLALVICLGTLSCRLWVLPPCRHTRGHRRPLLSPHRLVAAAWRLPDSPDGE